VDEAEFLAREADAARSALRSGTHGLAEKCTPHVAPFVARHPWPSVLGAGVFGFMLGPRKLPSLRIVLRPLRFLGKAWLEMLALAKVGERMAGSSAPASNGKHSATPPEPVGPSI
jgi:hypothetical protein